MIDSHCHLADKKFLKDLHEVLLRAEENGIDAFITIADTIEESKKCLQLAEKYEQIFCTIGVHPHAAKHWQPGDEQWLRHMLRSSSNVVAIGEIGLDYHYDHSPRDVQRDVFKAQLSIATDEDMSVVIHCREAIEHIRSLLDGFDLSRAVIHCCTEKWSDVQPLVERGCLLGFTGIATYPKSDVIRETIRHCPLTQLLIETDAPYLAPQSKRGERNEPAFVREVAECIATEKGISLAEVDAATTENTVKFFGLVD